MGIHDPYRLGFRPGPEPVEGPLPPPIRLVEEDDLLHAERLPGWWRWGAVGLALGFVVATILTAAATGGQYSLLTGGGWAPPGSPHGEPGVSP